MRSVLFIVALFCGICFSQSAFAQTHVFNVALSGAEEVPINASTATGSATAVFDSNSGAITINGNYNGLAAAISGSHLHGAAAPGANAGVLFALTNSGGLTGTFTGTSTLSAANINAVLDGMTYINIHSTGTFSGGEIRGQLVNPTAVPEPGSLAILGLASCVALVRRRRS